MKKTSVVGGVLVVLLSFTRFAHAQGMTFQGAVPNNRAAATSNASPATPAPTVNNLPFGWVDIGNAEIFAGWAVDPDSPNAPVGVNITSETNGKIKFVAAQTTSAVRPDVNSAYGISGSHGYGMRSEGHTS